MLSKVFLLIVAVQIALTVANPAAAQPEPEQPPQAAPVEEPTGQWFVRNNDGK